MPTRQSQRGLCKEPPLNEQTAAAMHTSCAASVAEGELIIIKPSGSVGLSTTSQTLAGSRFKDRSQTVFFKQQQNNIIFCRCIAVLWKKKKFSPSLSRTHTHTGRLPNCSVLTFFSTPQLLPNLRPSFSLGLPHTHQSGGNDFSTRRGRQLGENSPRGEYFTLKQKQQ